MSNQFLLHPSQLFVYVDNFDKITANYWVGHNFYRFLPNKSFFATEYDETDYVIIQ